MPIHEAHQDGRIGKLERDLAFVVADSGKAGDLTNPNRPGGLLTELKIFCAIPQFPPVPRASTLKAYLEY